MNLKNKFIYLDFQKSKIISPKEIIKSLTDNKIIILFILLFILLSFIFNYRIKISKAPLINLKEKIYLDNFELNKYFEIKEKLLKTKCSLMGSNQREFLNGVIRKFKPSKLLEVGVYRGGSSIIILNAINDIKDSKLYSIDINEKRYIGECVNKYFPDLKKNWKLYNGNIACEYLEKIGKNIDMAIIDTAHFEPGEILDFLMILPFLRENAIVIFHDIGNQLRINDKRREWAPYLIFNGIRGKKIFPSGNMILGHDIGAIILEKDQKKYYHDYFRLLGGQWQYFPNEVHIIKMRKFFKKYYDKDCVFMFEEASKFNRIFVKNHPI